MATALNINDVISLRAWCSLSDQAAVNSYNFEVVSVTGGGITDQNVSDAFDPNASTFYRAIMPTTATYNGIQAYLLKHAPFLPHFVKSTLNAGGGSGPNTCLPKNTAAILSYNTAVRGPIGRGRVYLPFIRTDLVTGFGVPTAGFNVTINSWASLLLNPFIVTIGANSVTMNWSLVHRFAPPLVGLSTTQIRDAESADKMGQMHKRGDYGRANSSPI